MGLIQRIIEAAGIPTISISLSREITRKLKPPRAVFTGLPMGHSLGFPGERFRQLQILRLLLSHLASIKVPGTLIDLNLGTEDDPEVHCATCGA